MRLSPSTLPRPRRLTLRARLLWAFLVPTLLVLVLVGVVSTTALRRELVQQVDNRLQDAIYRSETFQRQQPGYGGTTAPAPPSASSMPTSPGPAFLGARGQGEGTLGAVVVDGVCTDSGVLGARFQVTELTDAQQGLVVDVPADHRARTLDLGGSLGEYRVVGTTGPEGDVLVTGLPLSGAGAAVRNLVVVELLAGLVAMLAAAGAAALVIRRTMRPLDRVAATATRVSELPLASGEVRLAERVRTEDTDPHTEVGQVGAALNRMLDHVEGSLAARQESETQVGQFVADASNELRTPLASIRGYAELVRRRPGAVPEDVGHALRRVESEAVRMSELVEELLLLARLDAGRELATEDVDLTALAVDAVSDAHAAGPGHRWSLDLPDASVVVPGDAARLHQVLANLLANARTHTPDGTLVTVGLQVVRGWAVLSVTDDGPGIPEPLRAHVFERFARGDASRSRNAGSTGLGLAIVHAVVSAHGGTAEVASSPGHTVFTVRLPGAALRAPEADPDGGDGPDGPADVS